MNEILFRGKRTDNQKWIEGGYALIPPPLTCFSSDSKQLAKVCIVAENERYCADWGMPRQMAMYDVDPETVGQYINLCDKTGKKAFTGDITEDAQGRKWVIFACDGGFGICTIEEWKNRELPLFIYEGLSDPQNASWFKTNHTIIGNIHDMEETK